MKLYTEDEVRAMVRGLHGRHKQCDLAQEAGVSAQYYNDALAGRRNLNSKVAGLVGLRREVVFVPLLSSTVSGSLKKNKGK